MKTYKYQMHTHTSPCSRCAIMTPEELIRSLHEGGYSGCVITNHFRCGNTGIDRQLLWEEFVRAYEQDWLTCRELGEAYGLDIIFGVEEQVGGGLEILCYGITPQFLYDHPELRHAPCDVWYRAVHEAGGLCIQAHPFRERDYIPKPAMLPLQYLDGIEVYNAANLEKNNREAEAFARRHKGLILVSGADTHQASSVCTAGIETDRPIPDGQTLVEVLRSGRYTLLK